MMTPMVSFKNWTDEDLGMMNGIHLSMMFSPCAKIRLERRPKVSKYAMTSKLHQADLLCIDEHLPYESKMSLNHAKKYVSAIRAELHPWELTKTLVDTLIDYARMSKASSSIVLDIREKGYSCTYSICWIMFFNARKYTQRLGEDLRIQAKTDYMNGLRQMEAVQQQEQTVMQKEEEQAAEELVFTDEDLDEMTGWIENVLDKELQRYQEEQASIALQTEDVDEAVVEDRFSHSWMLDWLEEGEPIL